MPNDSALARLQSWYFRNCNGDWEHGNGIRIATLDNPGWSLVIQLAGTSLSGQPFEAVNLESGDDGWYHARVENDAFAGWCGPLGLEQLIQIFLDWSDSANLPARDPEPDPA